MKPSAFRIEYDEEVDALYIHLRDGEVAATREVTPQVFCDVAEDGAPLGFEVLFASKNLQGLKDALKAGHVELQAA